MTSVSENTETQIDTGVAEAVDTGTLHKRLDTLVMAVRALHKAENRGDLAELRRLDPDRPIEPALHRILARVEPHASLGRARRVALVLKILALASSSDVFVSGRGHGLGRVMFDINVSERRVQGLMTARGATLDDLLVRLARRLVAEGRLPYQDIGSLILGGPEVIEQTRYRIARDFWTAHESAETVIPAGEPA